MTNRVEDKGDELIASSFKVSDLTIEVGDSAYSCRVLKMQDSFYLWIGSQGDELMNDLSLAMVTNYDREPVSTRIMGSIDSTTSANIAKRLTKKYKKAFYVSFNLALDSMTLPKFEIKLQEQISSHSDIFA